MESETTALVPVEHRNLFEVLYDAKDGQRIDIILNTVRVQVWKSHVGMGYYVHNVERADRLPVFCENESAIIAALGSIVTAGEVGLWRHGHTSS